MNTLKYRSLFTGQEIDTLLSQVRSKIDSSLIVNDFSGGTTYIASAELAKNLNLQIAAFRDPNYFKALLLSIPDNNIYTDADKAVVDSLRTSSKFYGSFANAADRDAHVDPSSFSGGEITFLVDDGTGNSTSAWTRWDTGQRLWVIASFNANNRSSRYAIATQGNSAVISSFNYSLYNACKVLISCKDATGATLRVIEVVYAKSLNDTYIVMYGEIGNSTGMFTLATATSAGTAQLIATSLIPAITISTNTIAVI